VTDGIDGKEKAMAMFEHEIRSHEGSCPVHGQVTAEKRVPKLKFPFFVTGPARGAAMLRPFRCPTCGAKLT
jgi:hypothetical protein